MNEKTQDNGIRTRTWVIIVGAIALLCVLGAVLMRVTGGVGNRVAVIESGGKVIKEIDLDRVTEEYSFTVAAPGGGYNVVRVRPGEIRVTGADCPDRICVKHGNLTDAAAPIVCMPHELIITLRGDGDAADAEAR